MNKPRNIAPDLIGHQPREIKKRQPRYVKAKPKPVQTEPNYEGGKELFDIVYVVFILYLLMTPFLK